MSKRVLIEGGGGAGKSTLLQALHDCPTNRDYEARAFPSEGNQIGQLLRRVFRHETTVSERAMFYLFLAENEDVELPDNCIVDRHSCVSSLVYQTKHWHQDLIWQLTADARKMFDAIYILDVPVAIAVERIERRGILKPFYEQDLNTVRQRYLAVADMVHATVLDGTLPSVENAKRIIDECGL